jgi:hypothetical protein
MARKLSLMPRLAAIPLLFALIGWMEAGHPVPIFRLFTFLFVFWLSRIWPRFYAEKRATASSFWRRLPLAYACSKAWRLFSNPKS